jgi:peptidoglycan/LPS O-acetylase OafA/YrhL
MGILLYYVIGSGLTIEKMFVHNSGVVAAVIVFVLVSSIAILSYIGVLSHLLGSIFPTSGFGFASGLGFALIASFLLWFAAPLETALESAKNGRNLIFRYLIKMGAFLGVISYSLYLLHGKIYELSAMLARQFISMDSALYPILIVGGTTALCSVFYIYFEKPFMSNKQKEIYHSVLAST